MKKTLYLLFTALAASFGCRGGKVSPVPPETPSTPLITNISSRCLSSLDGEWHYIVDIYETGYRDYRRNPLPVEKTFFCDRGYYAHKEELIEYDFDAAPTLHVPGDWNTQKKELYYYEGGIWYRRTFQAAPKHGKRYFLYFGAANYECTAGLNGEVLGSHRGGYTPFNFEVTGKLQDGENSLVVLVDNTRCPENVPTENFDWWNYGGLTRSVYLVETPETFIRDYCVGLKEGDDSRLAGWIQLDGPQPEQCVTLSIPALQAQCTVMTDSDGYATFELPASVERWCPEKPVLYAVNLSSETDSVEDRIGFRTIETRGTEILLNGSPVFLKGISIHEEKPFDALGRACSREDALQTLGWAKEMNCNFVRLAHYPHSEETVRAAEEMGLMVWSEIPVYWTIDWTNPDTYANARAQLSENITRDRNRANIIIWSVANETPVEAPGRCAFLSGLIAEAREMDGTRLVSAAMEKKELDGGIMTVNDPDLAALTDLISFNEYVGWYDGDAGKCSRVHWTFDLPKPVFISEFGGGALQGLHGSSTERFTEEYMAALYRENIAMLSHIPGFVGCSPWILKDFRSPRRMLTGIQDDYNRKGLISEYGKKKDAFYLMQEWYGGRFPAVGGRQGL